jgi:Mitochondrial ribosomal protein (VAR1)
MTNNNTNININKRILPIFITPVIKKIIIDKKKSKYNLNILNPQSNLTSSVLQSNSYLTNKNITESQIIELFLKGINVYNKNLNDFISKSNNQELILYLKNDEFYRYNIRLSNLLYCIKRFFPIEQKKIKILFNKIELYLPKHLLKPNYKNIRFNKRLRYIKKFYNNPKILSKYNMTNKIMHWNRLIDLKHLLKICQAEINNLNYFIYKKKNIIEKIKLKNLINTRKQNENIISNSALTNINILPSINTIATKDNILLNNNNITDLSKIKIKLNQMKIKQTIKSIAKNNNFNCKTDIIPVNSNPVTVLYNNINKNPILNQYLKSMSNYNMKTKGIFIIYSNIIGYNFNTETNKLIKNIYNLLAATFKSMYCLISKPVFVITPDKIIIQLFYYLFIPNILKFKKIHRLGYKHKYKFRSNNKTKRLYLKYKQIKNKVRINLRKLSNVTLTKIYSEKFKILCQILSRLFKKPVELNLIRLHYPYNDSNILVNLLGIMINRIKVRIIFRKLFRKAVIKNLKKISRKPKVNIIPAFLSGLTIRIAGRLLTHRVIPRQTVKITRRGASAKGKINFSDVARITKKNKRGAFSITVSAGQNFF